MRIMPHGKNDQDFVLRNNERATNLLEIIHTDVCGPMNVEARGGYRYFLTFTDDLSRYGNIYLMKLKSELLKGSSNFRVKLKIVVTRG